MKLSRSLNKHLSPSSSARVAIRLSSEWCTQTPERSSAPTSASRERYEDVASWSEQAHHRSSIHLHVNFKPAVRRQRQQKRQFHWNLDVLFALFFAFFCHVSCLHTCTWCFLAVCSISHTWTCACCMKHIGSEGTLVRYCTFSPACSRNDKTAHLDLTWRRTAAQHFSSALRVRFEERILS